jgi:endoglucanase
MKTFSLTKRLTALLLAFVLAMSVSPLTIAGFLPSVETLEYSHEFVSELAHEKVFDLAAFEDYNGDFSFGASSTIQNVCAFCVVENMGPGWNLGNTFDYTHIGHNGSCSLCISNTHNPPGGTAGSGIWACGGSTRYSDRNADALETQWIGGSGNRTTQALINNVRAAGFTTIRIPVTWYKATSGPPQWNIRPDWMAQVKRVVDWAYNPPNNMTVILNTHHEELIFNNWLDARLPQSEIYIRRVWEQISETFNNQYGERLIFEGMNEPRVRAASGEWTGTSEQRAGVNTLNQRFVNTVRASGGNNQHRILLMPTYAASATTTALNDFVRPSDPIGNPTGNTQRLAMSVHAYVPNNFAGVGSGPLVHTWTEANITSMMNTVMTRANNSAVNMPVIFGEWGAVSRGAPSTSGNEGQRVSYATAYARQAANRRAAHVWWDNGATNPNNHNAIEGNFGLFHRRAGTWTTTTVPHMGLVFSNVTNAITAGHNQGVGERTGSSRCNCFQITSPNALAVARANGGSLQLTASVSSVTFSLGTGVNAPPAGVSINPTTRVLNVAANIPIGDYTFHIIATNAQSRTTTQTFTLTVSTDGATRGSNLRNFTMTPFRSETEMRFTWHSGSPTGSIQIWQQGSSAAPTTFNSTVTDEFVVQRSTSEGGVRYRVHQVTVPNLSRNTAYQYMVVWDNGSSSPRSFRTGGASSFQFLLTADIQIGTGGIAQDTADWTNTMRTASRVFPNAQFLLSLGDNVASTTLARDFTMANITPEELGGAQRRFDGLFAPTQMQNLPFMPVIGNHDALAQSGGQNNINPHLFHRHFRFGTIGTGSTSNPRKHVSSSLDTPIDYWFRYGSVLFIQLDSNSRTMDTNRLNWFNNAISSNTDATWRVAIFHHSPYSMNSASNDSYKTQIINNWIPRFEAAGIDIALSGHDHIYSRTHHMRANAPRTTQRFVAANGTITNGTGGATHYAVLNPDGISYLSIGSPTRSNARAPLSPPPTRNYMLRHVSTHVNDANSGVANTRTISTVNVTPHMFSIATYEINNPAAGAVTRYRMVDLYTIVKNPGNNNALPPGTVIPPFSNAWTDEPDPFDNVTHNWNINMATPGDRNVAHGATNHVRVLSNLQITSCMIESDEDFTVTVNYTAAGNNSRRRILAWTNLSVTTPTPNINSIEFLTSQRLRDGRIAISDEVVDGANSAVIIIPRELISSGTNTANTIYIAIASNEGPFGENQAQTPPTNRYTIAGNHRGGTEFVRFNTVRFNARANIGPGTPFPCVDCNNLPCRCIPTVRVEFRPNGGTHSGGGALVQDVFVGGGAVAPNFTRAGHLLTWDTLFHNVQTDTIVTAQWTPLGTPINMLYDMQTTNRVGANGFTDFTLSGTLSPELVAAFAPLGRSSAGAFTSVASPTRSVTVTGRGGVSQAVRISLNGASFGASNPIPIPTTAGRFFRIEYTAMFPNAAGTPRIRFEGAGSALLPNVPGGVATGGHIVVDAPQVPAGVVFTHSVTLTRAQLVAIGTRDLWLSAAENAPNIIYGNIRIVEHTAAPVVQHQVTFNLNNGIQVGTTPPLVQQITNNGSANAPTTTREGFIFNGWDGDFTNVTGPRTITARWLRLGGVSTGGSSESLTSVDVTYLARHVVGHSNFPISNRRLGNLRGLDRPPTMADVSIMARWLAGHNFNNLFNETLQ